MKSKQFGFISALALILWSCNANNVSRSARMLSLIEHTQGSTPSDLLSLQKKSLVPQQVVKTQTKQKQVFTQTNIQSSNLQETQLPVLSSYQDESPLTLESLYKALDAPQQTFTINASEDNTITCAQGTEIFIPKGSFELNKEVDNAMVSIHVKEYYGKAALLMGNLGTVSNDQLIESGGTIYMDATYEGQPIELQRNKKIDIRFAGGEELAEGMELFTGDKDAHGQINWQSNKNMYTGYVKTSNAQNFNKTKAYPSMHFNLFKWKLANAYKLPLNIKRIRNDVVFKFELDSKGNLLSVTTDSALSAPVTDLIMPILKKLTKWQVEDYGYSKKDKKKKKNTKNVTQYLTLQFTGRRVKVKKNYNNKSSFYTIRNWSSYIGLPQNEAVNNQSNTAMDSTMNYAFATNKLGWINCDRFLGTDAPLVNVVAPGNNESSAQVDYKLVLKKINSIMPAYTGEGGYQFYNIPEGYEATLLSIKIKNNQIYVGSKNVIAGSPVGELSFKAVTVDELKNIIEQINI